MKAHLILILLFMAFSFGCIIAYEPASGKFYIPFLDDNPTQDTNDDYKNDSTTDENTSVISGDETKEFRLNVAKSIVDPELIEVNQGDLVKFVLDTDNSYVFSVSGYGLSTNIAPGKLNILEFRANMKGEFEYSAGSAKGKLIVR